MADVRFLADEHIPLSAVDALRRHGIDIATAAELGLRGRPDLEHLTVATAERRVIVTHDRDFARLHSQGRVHAGIILLWRHPNPSRVVSVVRLVHAVLTAEEMRGRIEFL